jgi:ankyrin repeat protein
MTALHKAAEEGRRDTFDALLLAAPALADVRDKRGRTPIELGHEKGHAGLS